MLNILFSRDYQDFPEVVWQKRVFENFPRRFICLVEHFIVEVWIFWIFNDCCVPQKSLGWILVAKIVIDAFLMLPIFLAGKIWVTNLRAQFGRWGCKRIWGRWCWSTCCGPWTLPPALFPHPDDTTKHLTPSDS